MFAIGDTVMHPSEGVCKVENVTAMRFGGLPERDYYILKPSLENASNQIYMPVERGDALLRRLLSRAEITALIAQSKEVSDAIPADSRLRRETLSRFLSSGDYARIIRMIGLLHEERERRIASGRKPCATDEAILAQAERLIHHEFSCVLDMTPKETIAFIRAELQKAQG